MLMRRLCMNSTWASSVLFLPAIPSLFTSLPFPPPLAFSLTLPLPPSSLFLRPLSCSCSASPRFGRQAPGALLPRTPCTWSRHCVRCTKVSCSCRVHTALLPHVHRCPNPTSRPMHLKRSPLWALALMWGLARGTVTNNCSQMGWRQSHDTGSSQGSCITVS